MMQTLFKKVFAFEFFAVGKNCHTAVNTSLFQHNLVVQHDDVKALFDVLESFLEDPKYMLVELPGDYNVKLIYKHPKVQEAMQKVWNSSRDITENPLPLPEIKALKGFEEGDFDLSLDELCKIQSEADWELHHLEVEWDDNHPAMKPWIEQAKAKLEYAFNRREVVTHLIAHKKQQAPRKER